MKTKTIPKENTTLGCRKLFLSKNRSMIGRENHPRLEMLVDRLLVDELYLSTTIVVDHSAKVVTGFQ
jgi:hypothetical protein